MTFTSLSDQTPKKIKLVKHNYHSSRFTMSQNGKRIVSEKYFEKDPFLGPLTSNNNSVTCCLETEKQKPIHCTGIKTKTKEYIQGLQYILTQNNSSLLQNFESERLPKPTGGSPDVVHLIINAPQGSE